MSNDLISRSAVINLLKETGIIIDDEKGNLVVKEIERIPTAYDVDKVMEQLEKQLQNIIKCNQKCEQKNDRKNLIMGICLKMNLEKVIEIVKSGGK